jgi:hypothetical protein
VTFDDTSATLGALTVSPNLAFAQLNTQNCPSSCTFCDTATPTRGVPPPTDTGCLVTSSSHNPTSDSGWFSEQHWGAAAVKQHTYTQSGGGLNPARPNSPIELGVPFPVADFIHWNIPIKGDSPTSLALAGFLTVHPPAGDPVVLNFGVSDDGLPPSVGLNFLETDNAPPCDPDIQVSNTPCDDRWTLATSDLTPPPQVARGVTWHLTILGWDDLEGGFSNHLTTEEAVSPAADNETERQIYAKLTVDTNPTTTGLVANDATLLAQVAPAPGTGGTVGFRSDGIPIPGCAAIPVDPIQGTATCSKQALTPGTHTVTAQFAGAIGFGESQSAPLTVTVAAPPVPPPGPSSGGGATGPPKKHKNCKRHKRRKKHHKKRSARTAKHKKCVKKPKKRARGAA